MPEAITIRELLKDPIYKEWIKKVPELAFKKPGEKPWRIYARRKPDGPWSRKDFAKYSEAYAFLRDNISEYYDIVISCKRQAFKPPVVSKMVEVRVKTAKGNIKVVKKKKRRYYIITPPQDADVLKEEHKHVWCPYCRRPTLFLWYKKHHAIPASVMSPYERRCCVCGVRHVFIPKFENRS